ncbi:MAG: hypothetical protein HYT85_10575 [candidate division NC10 bacterium]|nr:hypothetical protein [candidate division NC10 bacterium]
MRFGIHSQVWTPTWSDTSLDLIDRARALGYSALETSLVNLATTWMAAAKADDIETVFSLMADDVVFQKNERRYKVQVQAAHAQHSPHSQQTLGDSQDAA